MIAVAVLVVLAAFVEIAARWWLRSRNAYYVFVPGMRLQLHVDRDVFPQMQPIVRFEVNRDGERGDEPPRSTRGLYRVLVAGGSQPEGYLLDQETSWPRALQRLLGTPESLERLGASHVHVGNIGRSGVGSEALDLILERVLPRYRRLQAIVILVGASDIFRWLEQGAPPSPPAPSSTSDIFRCHPESPFGWKRGELATVELLRRGRQRWLRPVEAHERAGKWVGRARAMRARATEVRTTMPDPAPMLDHFSLHFRKVLDKAMAHADRVLVVRQPWFDKDYTLEEAAHMWNGGVGQAWREEVTTYYSHDVLSRLMSMLDARAAQIAEEAGVEQLDLMPTLERSLATYYDLCHLTPGGAKVIAEAVASAIVQHAHAPASVRERLAAAAAGGRSFARRLIDRGAALRHAGH